MNKLTGGLWSLGKADSMRKVKNLDDYKEDFFNCCEKAGTPKDVYMSVWDRFDLGYQFNKAHACAYAKNTAIGAWLCVNYYTEYMANCMTLELSKSEPDMPGFIKECKISGVTMLPPDINASTNRFEPLLGDKILVPLSIVKNVGESAISEILSKRPFDSFDDFLSKVNKRVINKRIVERLIKAGCFDEFNKNRGYLLEHYYSIRNIKDNIPFYCEEIKLRYEIESYGFYLFKHPCDSYINDNINDMKGEGEIIGYITDRKVVKDKKGNDMCFLTMENTSCTFTSVVFTYTYKKYKDIINNYSVIKLKGKIEGENILPDTIMVV